MPVAELAARKAAEQPMDSRAERSHTLPARYYTDPGVHAREKEAIFFRNWQFAGHVEDVAEVGAYSTVKVLDQNLVILRGPDEKLRAFHNVCSHRGHELLEGRGKTRIITCPYHAWSYRIDGRLRKAPGSEKVEGFDAGEFCLKEVRLEAFANLLFVNLDPDAESLHALAGDLEAEFHAATPALDRLTRVRRLDYVLEANWKNVVDNFLECYHCPGVHPALCEVLDLSSYRIETHGVYSTHTFRPGRAENKAYRFDPGETNELSYFWALYPNTLFGVFPGKPNFSVLHVIPDGVERSRETWDFYCLANPPGAEENAMIDYVDEVLQPEDIRVVESVQRGQHSRGFTQGRFVVDRSRGDMAEHAVHHFQSFCRAALEG